MPCSGPFVAHLHSLSPCSFGSLLLLVSSSRILFRIFPKMPKGGGEDSDGLGDAHPATWESKLSRADERRIRQECFIPPFVKVRFSERGPEPSYVQTVTRSVFTRQCSGQAFASLFSPWSEICSPTWTYPLIR
jgi:hypothetical protein